MPARPLKNPADRDRPRIVLTSGEPAGIGPDLCVQLAQRPPAVTPVIVADPELLLVRAKCLGLPLRIKPFAAQQTTRSTGVGELCVLPVALSVPATPGQLEPANAGYVLETLRIATAGCLAGDFDALVTAPVHKGIINQAGIPFTGHTEYLTALTQARQAVMMLATPDLRVALATTHLPLREIADAITAEGLERVLRILDHGLRRQFGITRPRLLVCGLNPHAGEGGHLGREEIEIIEPLLARLRLEGMDLRGPLPADTLFTQRTLETADAVLAMYHDQGLPVLKHRGFGHAVNITLGLPIIRTSVDHGTALDLAGSGRAHTGSLEYAIRVATEMALSG